MTSGNSENIEIRRIGDGEIEVVRALLLANGWGARLRDADRFREVIHRSHFALVAVSDSKVVGFIRAISDGWYNAYISMVVVHPEYRRQGIATALMNHMMADGEEMTWVLRAGRDGVSGFYEGLGFSNSEVAMERTRKSN
ncbi:MAG: GNAT family N-acetyltransferase [Armatimonadota bacterium]